MVSRKKPKNISREALVEYIFRELQISKHHWEIELLKTSGWIAVRVIHKKSLSRIDKRVAYTTQNEIQKDLITCVQSAMSEIDKNLEQFGL